VRVRRPRGYSGAATWNAGMHRSWFRMRAELSLGKAQRKVRGAGGNSRADHAECSNHACRGARMRAGPSFGMVRRNFDVLEVTSVQPRRVRESRLSWACGCVLRLLREVAWRI
jgi:hypothetical protein